MERIATTAQDGFSGEFAMKLEEVHLSWRAGTAAAICSIIRAILNCAFVEEGILSSIQDICRNFDTDLCRGSVGWMVL